MPDATPSFNKPPLVETALSLQFPPIEGFTNAHLGLFWERVRHELPQARDAEPIPAQTELFGDQVRRRVRLPSFRLVAGEAAARLQMSSADAQTMVQLQNGRIVLNWRRVNDAQYPRWRSVRPTFEQMVDRFNTLLHEQGLRPPTMNQWEVTYVNHLVRGRDWLNQADWPSILPGLVGQLARTSVGVAETIESSTNFLLPDNLGRLHVDLHHGFTSSDSDAAEVLVLQLTARGKPPPDGAPAGESLELGHLAIVHAFCQLTGEGVHKQWERTR